MVNLSPGCVSFLVSGRGRKLRRQCLICLAIGVQRAFDEYVHKIKETQADGKLTTAEKRRAKALAIDCACNLAGLKSDEMDRILGGSTSLAISAMVKDMKSGRPTFIPRLIQ